MKTKFGNVGIHSNGYFVITSSKEGNHGKLLHRLIYESFWDVSLPPQINIHHKNGNKRDNCILNLEAVPLDEHSALHHIGKKLSDKTKNRMSESKKGEKHPIYGKTLSKDYKLKISKTVNSSGIFRVTKRTKKDTKQGFVWVYQYYDGGKQKSIVSVDLNKLKEKVLAKGLEWIEFDKEDSE